MYTINNFTNNDDIKTLDSKGAFTVIEYQRDLSVSPSYAATAYFCNEMNVRKRQVVVDVAKSNVTVQAGAMQWTVGNVNATTGVKGVGDLFGKALRGSVTGESAIKPEYTGNGTNRIIYMLLEVRKIISITLKTDDTYKSTDTDSTTRIATITNKIIIM